MCLAIDITPFEPEAPAAPNVASVATAIPVEECGGQLTISEEGGCACSLLADTADWNHAEWDLRPDVREPLAQTVCALAARYRAGFTLTAVWIGDPIKAEVAISPAELAVALRGNHLRNWTRYVVYPTPAV